MCGVSSRYPYDVLSPPSPADVFYRRERRFAAHVIRRGCRDPTDMADQFDHVFYRVPVK
jgi:hypothetical protein